MRKDCLLMKKRLNASWRERFKIWIWQPNIKVSRLFFLVMEDDQPQKDDTIALSISLAGASTLDLEPLFFLGGGVDVAGFF